MDGEEYLWEDRKRICGRRQERGGRILREEDTVCCATITIFYARPTVTTIVQKAAKDNAIVKQKLATIVLDKRRWRRSDSVLQRFFLTGRPTSRPVVNYSGVFWCRLE